MAAMPADALAALPLTLSVTQVASGLGVDKRTIYEQINQATDPFPPGSWIRVGTLWRLPRWRLYAALGLTDPAVSSAA